MQDSKNFLLTDQEGNNIAVISKKGKATPKEFNAAIELAVKEHFCAETVKIKRFQDDMTFDVSTKEDGIKCIREFYLEQVPIY